VEDVAGLLEGEEQGPEDIVGEGFAEGGEGVGVAEKWWVQRRWEADVKEFAVCGGGGGGVCRFGLEVG
jgi:hypothetical protein